MLHGLEAIYRHGRIVGFIRRAEYAYALDAPLACGYVELRRLEGEGLADPLADEALLAGRYELERMGERLPARLHLRSPFDPFGKRLRGDYSDEPSVASSFL